MGQQELVAGLLQELRRGSIVMLVLSRLCKPKYGYCLIKELEERGIPVEANTLYPLMRRLEGQGLLQSDWEVGTGKPRKYYVITAEGRSVLLQVKDLWHSTADTINRILEEEEHDEC